MEEDFELVIRPGIYFARPGAKDGGASQRAWLERSCALNARFGMILQEAGAYDWGMATMVIYSATDFLFERLAAEAVQREPEWMHGAFERLDPAAFVAAIVRTLPDQVGVFAEVLRDFYAWLVGAGEIDPRRGQYLACYFDTLIELHGTGPAGVLPTRASRRATATLARRITEARLRSQEREARKKTAA